MYKLNFSKVNGLFPVVIQNAQSLDVLMVGYMNEEALGRSLVTGVVWFFSRSRQSLWRKGETSGNELLVESISVDCDGDALLIKTFPKGPVCHRGTASCFTHISHKRCGEMGQFVLSNGSEVSEGKVSKPCRGGLLDPNGKTDGQFQPADCEKCGVMEVGDA